MNDIDKINGIVADGWLKNGYWYICQKPIDLTVYDHLELIHEVYGHSIFIGWYDVDKVKTSRIFTGQWNNINNIINFK
jgi:hypothetical protein